MAETPVLDHILFTEEQLAARVAQLGRQISADYRGKTPLFVGILRGSILFFADLLKQISIDCTIDFMCLSSYSGTESSGQVRTMLDLRESIKGRDVIIVEDIVDTGITMHNVLPLFANKGAASVKIACLLQKPDKLQVDLKVDYCALEIPNDFIVGYGLDYDGFGRNYKDIYTLAK